MFTYCSAIVPLNVYDKHVQVFTEVFRFSGLPREQVKLCDFKNGDFYEDKNYLLNKKHTLIKI